MKHAKKTKKKRGATSQPAGAPNKTVGDARDEETEKMKERAIHAPFPYTDGDLDLAAEIRAFSLSSGGSDAPSTSSGSGEASSSGSGSSETSCVENGNDRWRSKQKRVVAATGTVSSVLGRSYMVPGPRKTKADGAEDREKAEQFLCSMLGDESDLNLGIVRDVLCQCGYNVEKASDALLVLSASLDEQSMEEETNYRLGYKDDVRYNVERFETMTDCSSHSSECELHDSIWSVGCSCRKNYAEALTSSESHSTMETTKSHLSQKVLDSLFNISKSPEHNPSTMNWRNVVSKLESLRPGFDTSLTSQSVVQPTTYAKGDEYRAFRKTANQQWESVRSCYEKAATAYSKGARQYASYLSTQGQIQSKFAREADERASRDIFKARNKDIQNVITIDLHGQHVKQAMQMLKTHLLFVSYMQTVQVLRVITGCGTHGMGKSKVKQSVTKLLEKEGVDWTEENRGTVLITLRGRREFSFLDSDSDVE